MACVGSIASSPTLSRGRSGFQPNLKVEGKQILGSNGGRKRDEKEQKFQGTFF